MGSIQSEIERLNEIEPKWMERVLDDTKNETDLDRKLKKEFRQLFVQIRELYKTDKEKAKEEIKNALCDSASQLIEMVEKSLKIYYDTANLRKIQTDDPAKVKICMQYMFDNRILRYNTEYQCQYQTYGFESEEEFVRLSRTLDALSDYYISIHYNEKAVKKDFMMETDLNEEICEYFADLIEKNYQMLQLNYIIERLDAVNDSFEGMVLKK